jgi:hypothetical protein
MIMEITTVALLLVKEAQCPKLSALAQGLLTYRVLRGAEKGEIYIALTKNDGGGYFSTEAVPFERIKTCLKSQRTLVPAFPAIRLKAVFEGRSANNSSFMAAVLRSESLITKAADNDKLNVASGDLDAWEKQMRNADATPLAVPEPASSPVPQPAKDEKPKAKGKAKAKAEPEPKPEESNDQGA